MRNAPSLTMSQLNAMTPEAAVERLGHLFEHSPWIVAESFRHRPFASRETLYDALRQTLRTASPEQQVTLIRAHPDLVGRAALNGSLTASSAREQRAAGLGTDDLTTDEIAAFLDANERYKQRFGFPFVICARENRKFTILAGFEQRLLNSGPEEIAIALEEIERIAWYRLCDVVADDAVEDESSA